MDLLNPNVATDPNARLYARVAALEARLAKVAQGSTLAYAEALGQISVAGNGGGFPFSVADGPKITFTLAQAQFVGVLGSVEAQTSSGGSFARIQLFIDGTSGYWGPVVELAAPAPNWTPGFTAVPGYGTNVGQGGGVMTYFWLAAGTHTAEIYYGGDTIGQQHPFRNRRLVVAL